MTQLPLIEPTGSECPALAFQHAKAAHAARKRAAMATARGWEAIARAYEREAMRHDDESEVLAMLADFESRAGLQ